MTDNVVFTYSQDDAVSAGQSGFITESGAHIITITEAKLMRNEKGAQYIEFSGEADDDRKVNYLSVYSVKNDGNVNKFGHNMINAMMGCCGIQRLTSKMITASQFIAPEFAGKRIGLVLQKTLRTKQNGDDSYGFEIRIPFIADTRQTIAEKVSGSQPETVDKILSTLKDRDERKPKGSQQYQQPYDNHSDDNFAPF